MNPTLTTFDQHDGEKLKIAPGSIVFIEQMTPENRKRFEGAVSGIFYDDEVVSPVGEKVLSNAMLRTPFPRVLKLASLGRPKVFVEVERSDEVRVALLASTIVSYRGLSKEPGDHPEGARTAIRHRLGSRVFTLFAVQTFDEIDAMLEDANAGAPPGLMELPAVPAEEADEEDEHDDGKQPGDNDQQSGGRASGPGGAEQLEPAAG